MRLFSIAVAFALLGCGSPVYTHVETDAATDADVGDCTAAVWHNAPDRDSDCPAGYAWTFDAPIQCERALGVGCTMVSETNRLACCDRGLQP